MQHFAEKRSTSIHDAPSLGKTFDKIDHTCLEETLEIMGFDQGIIETLEDGYSKAAFLIEDEFGKSEKLQHSGIR